jgi:hypothetical protein
MLEFSHLRQTGWNDLPSPAVDPGISGGIPGVFQLNECFNSTTRGYTMPAFSFEKISPPIRRGPIAPIAKKQRGVIVQILGRFVEARVKRSVRGEKDVVPGASSVPPIKSPPDQESGD